MIAVGVSMDAFAVSVGKGLSLPKIRVRHDVSVALWFGGFQALMPLLGYFLGRSFASLIEQFDHWIAFFLLALIGGNMIREALHEPLVQDSPENESSDSTDSRVMPGSTDGKDSRIMPGSTDSTASSVMPGSTGHLPQAADFGFRTMLSLAIATSIDALACGVSFALIGCDIWLCILVIGLTTAAFSIAGLHLGHKVGTRFRRNSTLVGGAILILIGLKILVEHLFF